MAAPPKRSRKRKVDTDAASTAPAPANSSRTPLRIPYGNKEVALKLGARYGSGDGMPRLELIFLHSANGDGCFRWRHVTEHGKAEIAFVVIDDYQGQGVGTLLMRHLAVIARAAGLRELIAEVLPENAAMRKVFSKFGFQARCGPDPRVVHLVLTL